VIGNVEAPPMLHMAGSWWRYPVQIRG